MEHSEIIISGPKSSCPEQLGSVAEYLIPKMKSQPKDLIVQVDGATNETITSSEFLEQSLEIAEGLIEFGLEQEDVVILVCSNNIPAFVTATGILLSGGIFAPIDETSKTLELQHYFREFKPKFIICEAKKGEEIQACVKSVNLKSKVILIDSTESRGGFFSWEDIKTKVNVDDYVPRKVSDPKKNICMIVCSSGSTGMPKGVAISHFLILYPVVVAEDLAIPEKHTNYLILSPLSWISGVVLLLNSCSFGQTRYIPKSTFPEDVLEGIQNFKPHFLMVTPSNLLSLVKHKNFEKYDCSSVKVIFSVGGAMIPIIASHVKKIWKDIKIANFYGLSETCGGITSAYDSCDPNCIGKLLPDVKVKVVDIETGKSLGPNRIGELRVKMKTELIGYYNNEEATKAAFDENGWLRTGDLVYYDEEFEFYFVSRNQEIIQYLNYKISPAEIEAFIISLPGVKDVAVVPVPHETDVNHLRALVVKDLKSDLSAEYIIQKVKENLADRKRLREGVQFVDALPRTKVGKLRRAEAQKMIQITE